MSLKRRGNLNEKPHKKGDERFFSRKSFVAFLTFIDEIIDRKLILHNGFCRFHIRLIFSANELSVRKYRFALVPRCRGRER